MESRDWGGIPFPNRTARRFAEAFAERSRVAHGLLLNNGTVPLSIALRALGVKAGDEVITTGLTWVATASSIVYVNAVPVLVDIDPRTCCIDPEAVEAAVTPKTRAILTVHLGDQVSDLDALREIAARHGLALIEDCAHAHFAEWNGTPVGGLGDVGSFSFEMSKIMTCGEGGLLVTRSEELFHRAISLAHCGRKDAPYDRYDGRVFGWNCRPTELQAAVLLGQLEQIDRLTEIRLANREYLLEQLAAHVPGIAPLPGDPRVTRRQCYETLLRYDREAFEGVHRDRVCAALLAEGVEIEGEFYHPIHRDPLFEVTADEWPMIRERYGDRITADACHLPHCDRAAYDDLLWVWHPLLTGTRQDVDDILTALVKVRDHLDELRD
jgi:dTDP-4-amino-4,6-dideoxygalactose transaminase